MQPRKGPTKFVVSMCLVNSLPDSAFTLARQFRRKSPGNSTTPAREISLAGVVLLLQESGESVMLTGSAT